MGNLHGLDISHYQQGMSLSRTGLDFAIMKASEGTSWVDPACNSFTSAARAAGMKMGWYHFYRGNPTPEADHFLQTISNYIGDGIMVLDFEDHTSEIAGAREWLHRVHDKTGIWPMLYASQSVIASQDWSSVANDVPLWIARYASEIGDTGAWDTVTMWQHTSSGHVPGWSGPVDLDTFYGDTATWDAIATGKPSGDWFDMATKQDLKDAIQEWATSPAGQRAIADAVWNTDGVITAPSDSDPDNPYWTGRGWLGNIWRQALEDNPDNDS